MVVFGTSNKSKLFEQPLERLCNGRALGQLAELIAKQQEEQVRRLSSVVATSSTLAGGHSASATQLSGSLSTWAKLSKENNPAKRRHAAQRVRRLTLDANNNNAAAAAAAATNGRQSPKDKPNGGELDIVSACRARDQLQPSAPLLQPQNPELRQQQHQLDQQQNQHHQQLHQQLQQQQQQQLASGLERRLLLASLPEPIGCLLRQLYQRGPQTVGIFRKSPNAKHCRELRQRLEQLQESSAISAALEQYQVNVLASVFKEWLRSLPDCLLQARLYPQWIDVAKLIEPLHQAAAVMLLGDSAATGHSQPSPLTDSVAASAAIAVTNTKVATTERNSISSGAGQMSPFELRERRRECVRIVRQLLETMSEPNVVLLKALVCVLWHIARASDTNMMSAQNLGVCVGQSLLRPSWSSSFATSSPFGAGASSGADRRSPRAHSKQTDQQQQHRLLAASRSASQLPSGAHLLPQEQPARAFAKHHRRARSQSLLGSTLSLSSLTGPISFGGSPSASDQQQSHSSQLLAQPLERASDEQESAKYVPILLAFMIREATALFGAQLVELFGDDEQPTSQQNEEELQATNSTANQLDNNVEDTPIANDTEATREDCTGQLQHGQQLKRRHLSTSVLVHVGRPDGPPSSTAEPLDLVDSAEDATTSILVLQAPSPRRQSAPISKHSPPQQQPDPVQPPTITRPQPQPGDQATEQQRPLSVTGSTVSSSSTSGVHSDSPTTFSSGSCSSSVAERRSPTDSRQSSSPGSRAPSGGDSSGCASPARDHEHESHHHHPHQMHQQQSTAGCHIEVTPDQLTHRYRSNSSDLFALKVIDASQPQQQRQPIPSAAPRSKLGQTQLDHQVHTASQQRPHSMHNLSQQTDLGSSALALGANAKHRLPQQQQQHQVAASASTQVNRIPKIPFQYTTSSYGGEAVLYYPSRAHQVHRQQKQQQQQQEQQQQFNSIQLHQQPSQQQIGHNLYRPPIGMQLQQQQPRSHVLMLRDYYLSLQRQQQHQQRNQQQRLLLEQRCRESQRALDIRRLIERHQQAQYSSLSHIGHSLGQLHQSAQESEQQHSLIHSAVQVGPPRPRLAIIRPNGLYVKQLEAKQQQQQQQQAPPSGKQLVRSSSSSHLSPTATSVSNSSSSNASSADESEWMESTMV